MKVELFTSYVPHARELGLTVLSVERGSGRATIRQPFREELIGDPERRIVHGGVITTLLDTLGGICVFAFGEGLQPQATLDLRIDYLRPALPDQDLFGDAECFHATRHVAFVRGICHQGDPARPVANMTATFMIADLPARAAGPRSP